jgi:tape measure domain-containing protein
MSKTVDEKVVEMRFDNAQFERNVTTSMGTLDKLKKALNFKDSSKSLETVSAAAKKVDMSGLYNGVETVRMKFSALEVMAVTALANITNSAVNAGKRMISALTIQPVKDGFAEYETQMNAVQTILANTQKEGTNVKMVNAALDDLNHYADKTIYNFTEMTRNIGTFTAAGVKLGTSVSSIKGIANLAAVSGSNSQQASTAMYQLSQAIAAGTVKLMDWNSVVNAGMGGQVFQDALIRTSEHLQTGAKAAIAAKGTFRESLQTGWLTTEVLTQTLDQFSTAADTQEEYEAAVKKFVDQGYSKEEAKQMADMAKTAGDAATKVKTFSQLIDTLKEPLGSGWAETWRTVIGDFEEARELWTSVSNILSDAINKSSDARNAIVKEWADLGGRTAMIDSFRNAFNALLSVTTPIKEAFNYVFPPATAKQLLKITENVRNLTAKMRLSDSAAAKLEKTFEGLFSIVSIGTKIIGGIGSAILKLATSKGVSSLASHLLNLGAAIGEVISKMNESIKMDSIANGLGKGIDFISGLLVSFLNIIDNVSDDLNKKFKIDGFLGVLDTLSNAVSKTFSYITDNLSHFHSIFTTIGSVVSKGIALIGEYISKGISWIHDNISFGDVFTGLVGGGLFVTATKIISLIDLIKDKINSLFGKKDDNKLTQIIDKFGSALDSLHDSLQTFTTGIKATSLLAIAIAIGILAGSMDTLSKLSVEDIGKSLFAIASLFSMLTLSFKSLNKTLSKYNTKGLIKAAGSILILAEALKVLSKAMVTLSGLSWGGIAKGLTGVGVGLIELCSGIKAINGVKIPLSTSLALLALAESCKMLGDAMSKFGKLSWGEIAHGLIGMGGALGEFVAVLKGLNKVSGMQSIFSGGSLLIAVQSLSALASGLSKFGQMDSDSIKRGLVGMGGSLAELATVLSAIGKIAGFSSLFAAGSILAVTQGLDDIANAFGNFGSMSWDEIAQGLVGMGGALAEVGTVITAVSKLAGFSSLFAAGSILAVTQGLDDIANAFGNFGSMSWDEIAQGLVGMGGALAEVGTVITAVSKLAGFSSLFAAGSILAVTQGLDDIANAFGNFGSMSWDEIAQGLVGMGGALAEVGTVAGLLGTLAGLSGIIGSGSLVIAVQSLDDLYNAFGNFGSMSWDEIAQGLVGMGGALAEVATISGVLGTLGGFASIIGGGSILIAVQGLGDLADALKKFGSMSWDEIEIGLTAMGEALGKIAVGGLANTLSIFGSLSIAAVAEPLGVLAESIKKWAGVSVPEGLEGELSSLASGITSFTFGGLGASAISESAPAIGVMADSIKKWSGVTVPDNIEQGLTQIANGVKAFTLAFVGGATIDSIVGPLGKLSSAIKKWNDVKVPKNLDKDLKKISEGIKSFSTAFVGGWTLSAVTGPIGDLAKAIKKWNDVSVPEGIDKGLKRISGGIKSFSTAFVGGWTLSAVTGPIGDLANAIKKWNYISIPEGIENQIGSLAKGVKNFENIGDISNATNNVTGIVNAVYKINELQFETISSGLSTLSTSIQTFASNTSSLTGIGTTLTDNFIIPIQNASLILPNAVHTMVNSVTGILTSSSSQFQAAGEQATNNFVNAFQTAGPRVSIAMTSMMTSMSSTVASQSYAIVSAFDTMMTSVVSAITSRQAYFSSAGSSMMISMSLGVSSGAALVISSVNSAMGSIATSVQTKSGAFSGAGRKLMNSLRTGINSGTSGVLSQLNTIMTNMRTTIISRGSVFMSAGVQLMNSLSRGISSGGSKISSALASSLRGCSTTIRSYYSSFETAGSYLGSGLVSGINSKLSAVYKAGYRLGEKAVAGEKAGQQSASPSKLTRKAGRWLGEGLIIGMKEMSTAVYSSGKSMGRSASDSITEALSSISNIDDWNVDTDPSITIHPVFDMSNIDSGLSYIDSALSGTKAVQLSSSVAAITPVSSLTNQNGSNQDVVNAINKLRKDIGSKTGNTYNLGGITYDDGSNVADAVQSLVRAAKIEGRK